MIAQWVKKGIAKPDKLGSIPRATPWKEKTDSYKLSFDLYVSAVAHRPPSSHPKTSKKPK